MFSKTIHLLSDCIKIADSVVSTATKIRGLLGKTV